MQTFQQDPAKNHLWVEDPEITAQGKADERARQFLFWVFNTGTVDTHPALIKVWNLAKNISFFLLLIVVASVFEAGGPKFAGSDSNFEWWQ